jgi:AraC-like DNA-binding protein
MFVRATSALPNTVACDSGPGLIAAARTGSIGVIIGDPTLDAGGCADALIEARKRFPGIEVVAYVALTPATIPCLLRLAAQGVSEVIIRGHDDSVHRFGQIVQLAAMRSTRVAMLAALQAELARLPGALRDAVGALFRNPIRYRTVTDLALSAGMGRRTVYRQLQLAGIASPRLLVASGRVLLAVTLLRDPCSTLVDIARRLRFYRADYLTEMIACVTGLTPQTVRVLDDASLVRDIAERLRTLPDDPHGEPQTVPDSELAASD